MKRFYFSLFIIALMVALSIFTLNHLYKTKNQLIEKIDSIAFSIQGNDKSAAAQKTKELTDAWKQVEPQMIRYVRHSEIDLITSIVARLEPLLIYQNTSEFMANLNEMRTMVEHVWESEVPNFTNLF